MPFATKRVYEPPSGSDGTRVLVDGLWPRGLARRRAAIDLWLRELAPSPALRRWFAHEPSRWRGFRERYARELDEREAWLGSLLERGRRGRVTLLYASREPRHNNAVALKQILDRRLRARLSG